MGGRRRRLGHRRGGRAGERVGRHRRADPGGAMDDRPLVTFVVPTKNAARTLAACLASVRAQEYDRVELVVVDNHSTDDTADIAHRYADRVDTLGPERSAQRNHGWRVANGEHVAF